VLATSLAELQVELQQMETLLDLARQVYAAGEESKFEKLRDILRDPEYQHEKLIIFTEHRDTLDFLVHRLEGMGFTGQIAQIHGGMDYREREEQVAAFRRPVAEGGALYLVATDAAGEGINLQVCWLMVNYDLPWNPARLEQRMGRIHRYGQKHDQVYILNLVAGNTREGRVMKTVLEKLERIRRELGSDKVFDVIGELFEGVSLREYMAQVMTAADESKAQQRIEGTLTKEQVKALQARDRSLFGDGGAVRSELPRLRASMDQETYRRLLPGYVRHFLEKATPLVNIGIEGDLDALFTLQPLTSGAMDWLLPALEIYPPAMRTACTVYAPRNQERAIFLHPGEPVFDRFRTVICERFKQQALQGAVFIDPTAERPYFYHLAQVVVLRQSDPTLQALSRAEVLEYRLIGLRHEERGEVSACPVEHLLLLSGEPENLINHLVYPRSLVIAIRPSFIYRFQQLWLRDTAFFWEVIFRVQRHDGIPGIGKLIGPAVAVELATQLDDLDPLLNALYSINSDRHEVAEQALQHVIGALVTSQQRPVLGIDAGPWCQLVERISQSMQGSVIFSVRVLLSYLVEHPEAFTTDQRRLTGEAARRLLEFAWNQQIPRQEYIRFALEAVCRTYESNLTASRTLLHRSLMLEHLAAYGYFELFTLACEIKRLIPLDPEFVRDIYIAAFSYEETSQEKTSIGNSQILSLLSTRSQDYASALHQLAQMYPDFLNEAPILALHALISIMNHRYSLQQGEDEIFDFNGIEAHIRVSRRGYRISPGIVLHPDQLGHMLNAFRLYLEGIADDPQHAMDRQALLHILANNNHHAILWRNLLIAGTATPPTLGREIRWLAWAIPILLCTETIDAICDFLSSIFSDLAVKERDQIERAILSIHNRLSDDERTIGKHIQDHLLRCLAQDALVTEEAKRLCEQLRSGGEAPPNEQFAASAATWGSATSESEEPYHHLRQQIRAFTQAHLQASPTTQETEAIFPALRSLGEALSTDEAQEADPSQHFIVWCDVVEACECITGWDQFSCETEIGQFVLSFLLEAAKHPTPLPNSEEDDNFDEDPFWGVPSPRIDAAAGLTKLTQHEICITRILLEAVLRLSFDAVPAVRFQVLGNIGSLYHTMPDLMWDILEHAARNERSRGVLQSALHTLGWLAGPHPDGVTALVKTIYERTNTGAGANKVHKACVSIFAGLYLYREHQISREMVFSIIDKPDELHDENWQIMSAARDVLRLGTVTPSDDQQDAVRQRGWQVMLRTTKSIRHALQHLQSQQSNTVQSKDEQEQVRNLYCLAESVATDLYFASGASDQTHNSEEVTEVQRRLFIEAEPLLDELGGFNHPGLVHYLIKTLAFLIPVDPARIFTRIGQIVLNAKGGGYQFEPSAIDLIVRIVERYLAEFREVLREDEQRLQLLIEMLDGFVEVGWPSARRLAYRLEEIFY
jgi:hypothetical protein